MSKIAIELTPDELANTQNALDFYLEVVTQKAARGDDEDAVEQIVSISNAQRALYVAGAMHFTGRGDDDDRSHDADRPDSAAHRRGAARSR